MKTIIRLAAGAGLACAGLTLLPPAGAGEAAPNPVEIEYQQLLRDIPSLYLINGLFLSADQARRLAALQAEGKRALDQGRLDLDKFFLNHKKELEQKLEQMLRGGAESGKERKGALGDLAQLQKIRREWVELEGARDAALNEVAEKALAVLTPAQTDILKRFVPCFIPPQDFRNPERVGQADDDPSLGEAILSKMREIPENQQTEGREKALDRLVAYVMAQRRLELTAEEMQTLRTSLGKNLDQMALKARKLSEADFQLEKAKLGKTLLGMESKSTAPLDARQTLDRARWYLLNPGVHGILVRRAQAPDNPIDSAVLVTQELQHNNLRERGKPFQVAGLANELYLTPGQAAQLLPVVRAVVTRRQALEEQAVKIIQEARPTFLALVQELTDQQPTAKTEAAASRYHNQIRTLYQDDYLKELLVAERQVDLLLAADQVQTLMRRESKTGWGKSSNWNGAITRDNRRRAEKLLDTMEKSEPGVWVLTKADACRQFVESCLGAGATNRQDVDIAAQAARAEQVLDRARALPRESCLKMREDLSAELAPRRNQPRPAVYGGHQSHGSQLESLSPTTYLLFNPAMVKVLEVLAARRKS
jgi:hypothetical protein